MGFGSARGAERVSHRRRHQLQVDHSDDERKDRGEEAGRRRWWPPPPPTPPPSFAITTILNSLLLTIIIDRTPSMFSGCLFCGGEIKIPRPFRVIYWTTVGMGMKKRRPRRTAAGCCRIRQDSCRFRAVKFVNAISHFMVSFKQLGPIIAKGHVGNNPLRKTCCVLVGSGVCRTKGMKKSHLYRCTSRLQFRFPSIRAAQICLLLAIPCLLNSQVSTYLADSLHCRRRQQFLAVVII